MEAMHEEQAGGVLEDWTVTIDENTPTEELRVMLPKLGAAAARSGAAYARDVWRVIHCTTMITARGQALPSTARLTLLSAIAAIELAPIAKNLLGAIVGRVVGDTKLGEARTVGHIPPEIAKVQKQLNDAFADAETEWWDVHCPCVTCVQRRSAGVEA
jgi:hypothetical protein